ncbi:MAG: hypothetical protein IKZ16_03875 [Clostridia bacterium]|nr:hypothetical protein [Clostridia bacterium]
MNQQDQQNYVPRSAREETKRLKKIILITFCVLVALVIVYYAFTEVFYKPIYDTLTGYFPWLEKILDDGAGNKYEGEQFSIYFYPIDYDLNILEYKEYLDLDRNVYYYSDRNQNGSVVVLNEKNVGKQAQGVTLLYNMLNSIIMGDADAYNACFSDLYFENKGIDRDPGFTMTQLYDMKITNMGQKTVTDSYGTYSQFEFVVQYSIHEGNGTFRNDIPSDSSAAQYIVITDRNGELLIENVIFPYFFSH